MPTAKLVALTLACFLCVAACATSPELEPAITPKTVAEDIISKRVQGIEVRAEVDAWSGWPEVKTRVTPLKVTIDNDGAFPIRIRYPNFWLSTDEGERFAAIPPLETEGDVSKPGLAREYRNYYDGHQSYWRRMEVDLPTEEMLEVALLEGVLEPRGVISGFVYFEKVDQALDQVSFTAEIVDAKTGRKIASLKMPLLVVR